MPQQFKAYIGIIGMTLKHKRVALVHITLSLVFPVVIVLKLLLHSRDSTGQALYVK